MKVQYGCGWDAPVSWVNFDASPVLRYERIPFLGKLYVKNEERFPENVQYGDIIKGLPIPENSCELVYCSHVLEHISLTDFRIALRNTYNILNRGGIFRLVMPDLEFHIQEYLNDSSSSAAINFLRNTLLGKEIRQRNLMNILSYQFGNREHLWLWDYKSLKVELENVGFSHIRRAHFGDSGNKSFNEVENEERWINCLGVECVKLD